MAVSAKPVVIAKLIMAIAGRPVAKWSPRPPLPQPEAPARLDLGEGLALWRLPLGLVRIRERHRKLEADLSATADDFRFPLMMADDRITPWLDCTAWLVETPEGSILVDTGEGPGFAAGGSLAGVAGQKARLYPRIIDATGHDGRDLATALAQCGEVGARIKTCVLTHLHSDHVGHLGQIPKAARIVVSELETRNTARSGRLPELLPVDGRVGFADWDASHPELGTAKRLTGDGRVLMVPLPGHTPGHCGVLIEAGGRRVLIAGDSAFDDAQVERDNVPGITEDRAALLATHAAIRRLKGAMPTLTLFTHDPANTAKLAAWGSGG